MKTLSEVLGLASLALFAAAMTPACSNANDSDESSSEGAITSPGGAICGGIAGFLCEEGYECQGSGPVHPDSSGHCVAIPAWDRCSTDADVVAVDEVGCCPLGRKEAVNKAHAAAYAASFDMSVCGVFCPEILYVETRQAQCVDGRAEMVEIDQIVCGGHTPNPHACPTGYTCQGAGLPVDAPGRCEKDAEPQQCGDTTCSAGATCQNCWGRPACVPAGAFC